MGRTFESIDMLIMRKSIARNAKKYAVHWTAVILKDLNEAYHMMSLYESMNQKNYNILECVWMCMDV